MDQLIKWLLFLEYIVGIEKLLELEYNFINKLNIILKIIHIIIFIEAFSFLLL